MIKKMQTISRYQSQIKADKNKNPKRRKKAKAQQNKLREKKWQTVIMIKIRWRNKKARVII